MTAVRPDPEPGLISLVIPVYNERDSLEILVNEIFTSVARLPDRRVEIIFVDDGSTDDSWATIQKIARVDTRVRGIRFRRNFGKAAALNAGFRITRGEVVFTLDADLQDDPVEIPQFLEMLTTYDLISGYKQVRHDPWHKVFPSRVFNWMVSRLTGVKLHDHNCGYKCYKSAVTREVKLYGELHRYVPVLAASRGFKVGERVVQHRARKFGKSKFGFSRFLKGFLDLLHVKYTTTYSRRPMHFFGTMSFLLMFFAAGSFASMLLLMFLNWTWFTVNPMIEIILLGISLSLVTLAGVGMMVGLIAESQALQRTDDPFAIAEETP